MTEPAAEPTVISGTEVVVQARVDGEWVDVDGPRLHDPDGYDVAANECQDDEAVVWGPV